MIDRKRPGLACSGCFQEVGRKITGFSQEVVALSRCLGSVTYITLMGEHSMYRGGEPSRCTGGSQETLRDAICDMAHTLGTVRSRLSCGRVWCGRSPGFTRRGVWRVSLGRGARACVVLSRLTGRVLTAPGASSVRGGRFTRVHVSRLTAPLLAFTGRRSCGLLCFTGHVHARAGYAGRSRRV